MGREENKVGLYRYTLFAAVLCLTIPVFFLEKEALAGFFSLSGLFLFLTASKLSGTKKQRILLALALWLSMSVRFCMLFGPNILGVLAVVVFLLPFALLLSLSFLFEQKLYEKRLFLLAVVVFPLVFTGLIIAYVLAKCGNLFNLFTYAMCLPTLMPLLIWMDEYVLTAVLALVFSLLSFALVMPERRQRLYCSLGGCTLAFGLLACGWVLQSEAKEPDYSLRVAVATSEKMSMLGETTEEYTIDDRLDIFRSAMDRAYEKGAELVVFSEEFTELDSEDYVRAISCFSSLCRKYSLPALTSMDINMGDDGLSINQILYFDAEGSLKFTYVKHNLVPLIEAGTYVGGPETPAAVTTMVGGHNLKLSAIICFDVNDAYYLKHVPEDTELLLIPSWDWNSTNVEQLRTRICSVECRTTILKHTYEGFTFVSGPYGLTSEILDNRGEYESVKMIEVPIWEK